MVVAISGIKNWLFTHAHTKSRMEAGTLSKNADNLESKYCCKILEIMNKLMNFFMNHGLIFLNTAPTPQNIVLMIVEKHILII